MIFFDAAELPDTRERNRKDTREHVMPPSFARWWHWIPLYLGRNNSGSQPVCSSPPRSISAAVQ